MKKKIAIVAGGTGGHIIPAIAFGNWGESMHNEYIFQYICGTRPIEAEIYGNYGIKPYKLPLEGSPLGKKSLFSFFSRSAAMLKSLHLAFKLLKETKPDMCLLFGGYISFPILLAAHSRCIPVIVHEQNARAGKLTRLASAMGDRILAGWGECVPLAENRFKTVGVPVRESNRLQLFEAWNILHIGSKVPKGPIIVVMGGSLGSRTIYGTICTLAARREMEGITFLLVGGNGVVTNFPSNVISMGKCWDLGALISLASAAVVRGGASTLFEMAVYHVPSIIIPWKESAANHQLMNATCFIKDYGGFIWHEDDAIEALVQNVVDLVNLKNPLSDVEKETDRLSVNEKICEEIRVTIGREIL